MKELKKAHIKIPTELTSYDSFSRYIGLSENRYEEEVFKAICGLPVEIDSGICDINTYGWVAIAFEDLDSFIKIEGEDPAPIGRFIEIEGEDPAPIGQKSLKDLHPILQNRILKDVLYFITTDSKYNPLEGGNPYDCYVEEGYPIWLHAIADKGNNEQIVRIFHEAVDCILSFITRDL